MAVPILRYHPAVEIGRIVRFGQADKSISGYKEGIIINTVKSKLLAGR